MPPNEELASALWYVAPRKAELREERLSAPETGEVRVRALWGAISRGTEALVFNGSVPTTEFDRMRSPHMGGKFPFPVKYGYSVVGSIEIGPEQLIGRPAFVLHPHQTLFNVPLRNVMPLSDGLPVQRAVMAASMETALNAVWDGTPGPADRVAVVGAGTVGILVAFLCSSLAGAEVTLIDVEPTRKEIALKFGIAFASPHASPVDCDLVFHASATASGLSTALACAGVETKIIELSWYGNRSVEAPLGAAFHSQRLRLISSQVGEVARSHRARWTRERRLAAALKLLLDERLDALLSPPMSFCELPTRLPGVLDAKNSIICQVINYR
ncbi:MAG: zinc-binding alcohol dehydrogenase [Xanthobacteraceae bacterium]